MVDTCYGSVPGQMAHAFHIDYLSLFLDRDFPTGQLRDKDLGILSGLVRRGLDFFFFNDLILPQKLAKNLGGLLTMAS